MIKNIKQKIEDYVLDELDLINKLGTEEDDMRIKNDVISHVKTLVDILQKEDINISSAEIDKLKIKNDIEKVENDYKLNCMKVEIDQSKIDIDKIKVEKDYEVNCKKIDIDHVKINHELEMESRKINVTEIKNNSDVEIKKQELINAAMHDVEVRTDRLIKICVDGMTILIPIIFYNIWMNKGFKFEETGTYTSNTFKNMFSKFRPTK